MATGQTNHDSAGDARAPDTDRYTRICMKQLGLEAGFTTKQLRTAFLRGSFKLSPDRGGDAAKFIALQKANAHLANYARREEVDIANDLERALAERQSALAEVSGRKSPGELSGPGGDSSQARKSEDAQTNRPRYKNVADAFSAVHGDQSELVKRGHGGYLQREVRSEFRPPDRIAPARLNSEFERINQARGAPPLTVSTHVVEPVCAQSTIAYPIYDDAEDFGDGRYLSDLQAAYGAT